MLGTCVFVGIRLEPYSNRRMYCRTLTHTYTERVKVSVCEMR